MIIYIIKQILCCIRWSLKDEEKLVFFFEYVNLYNFLFMFFQIFKICCLQVIDYVLSILK